MKRELVYSNECYAIVGAAIEVHQELGCGFLEAVYQEALELEFDSQGLPFDAQPVLQIRYKEHNLKKEYVPDIISHGKIIVELRLWESSQGKKGLKFSTI